MLIGGAANDTFRAGLGSNDIRGGDGTDRLIERANADITLTDTQIDIGLEMSSLSSIESAELIGGIDANTIDASGYTLGGVTLDGGFDVFLEALNDGAGVGVSDVTRINLAEEPAALLAGLNNGDGVSFSAGADFRITLTDGSSYFDVDLTVETTVKDVLLKILDAADTAGFADRVAVTIADDGSGVTIADTAAADPVADLTVTALGGSTAALDLGLISTNTVVFNPQNIDLNGTTYRRSIVGEDISSTAADLRIELAGGAIHNVDLSGVATIRVLMARLNALDEDLSVELTTNGKGLVLKDTSAATGTLTVTNLNGSTAATDLGIETTAVVAAGAATLSGSDIAGTGARTLDGRGDDDVLRGTAQVDRFYGGGGDDSITGNGSQDVTVVMRDANVTLADTSASTASMTVAQGLLTETDSLTGTFDAEITTGDGANTIDASGYTLGSLIADGGDGNDTIRGGSRDDILTGGLGIDSISGGGQDSHDTLLESGNNRFILKDASLDRADGANEVVTLTRDVGVSDGTFTISFDADGASLAFSAQSTDDIAWNADASTVLAVLAKLTGLDEESILVDPADNGWVITFVREMGGMDVAGVFTVDGSNLTGGSVAVAKTDGALGLDVLSGIEKADLTGSYSRNTMDASMFSGFVRMDGGSGGDVLIGTSNADALIGGAGVDEITGGRGNDTLSGDGSYDILVESGNFHMTLTDSALVFKSGAVTVETDTISGFERAELTGGASANVIDASGFSGVDRDTELRILNFGTGNRTGVDLAEGNVISIGGLEDTMPLAALNGGAGIGMATGDDFRITLSDGTTIDVDISGAEVLSDIFAAVEAADAKRRSRNRLQCLRHGDLHQRHKRRQRILFRFGAELLNSGFRPRYSRRRSRNRRDCAHRSCIRRFWR